MDSGSRRAAKNERTRRALLAAARTVFVERGFHGASLDGVAEAAGLTKGAVYSRFASKADLFLALLEERVEERVAMMRAAAGRASLSDDAATLGRQWGEVLAADLPWTLVVIEFRVHVARDPDLNRRFGELHARLLAGACEAVRPAAGEPAGPGDPSLDELVHAVYCLGLGVALERAADPAAFPAERVAGLNAALIAGTSRATAEGPTTDGATRP